MTMMTSWGDSYPKIPGTFLQVRPLTEATDAATTLTAAQTIGGMVTMTPTALVGFGCNYIHRRHGFWPAPLTIVQPTEGERFGFAIERLKHVLGG